MNFITKIIGLVLGLIILVTFLPVYNTIIGATNTTSMPFVSIMLGIMVLIIVVAAIFGGFITFNNQTGGGDTNGVY